MDQELQVLNTRSKMAEWAERISECRNSGQSVRSWCLQNGISEPTYYKWQKKLYEMAKTQRESRFAEITPRQTTTVPSGVAVTLRLCNMTAEIHNRADAATLEAVLRILQSC